MTRPWPIAWCVAASLVVAAMDVGAQETTVPTVSTEHTTAPSESVAVGARPLATLVILPTGVGWQASIVQFGAPASHERSCTAPCRFTLSVGRYDVRGWTAGGRRTIQLIELGRDGAQLDLRLGTLDTSDDPPIARGAGNARSVPILDPRVRFAVGVWAFAGTRATNLPFPGLFADVGVQLSDHVAIALSGAGSLSVFAYGGQFGGTVDFTPVNWFGLGLSAMYHSMCGYAGKSGCAWQRGGWFPLRLSLLGGPDRATRRGNRHAFAFSIAVGPTYLNSGSDAYNPMWGEYPRWQLGVLGSIVIGYQLY